MSLRFSPLQRRALEAMGYALVAPRARAGGVGGVLGQQALPPRLRSGLERWVGALWSEWPAPAGRPADAAFKRALWRRVRDWRRGG
jgi:hypothetical protein